MSDSLAILESVRQTVMLRLPGATPEIVDFEARWLISEFLSETRLWRETFSVGLTAGVVDYAIPIDDKTAVTVLMKARIGTTHLAFGGIPAIPNPARTGRPTRAMMLDDRTVRVHPIPTTDDIALPLDVNVALTLLVTVDAVPPDVMRPYHHYLLDGLLARMYAMPDKPWTNTRMAEPHLRRFQSGKSFVRRELDASRGYGSLSMRGPRFGV